jgi:hypothetical protein
VIFKLSLASVEKTLGKELFAECYIFDTRQRNSFFAECFLLPRVFCVALGKELLSRLPEKNHSGKYLVLGKEPNSGSEGGVLTQPL